jgi:hypothetical protein
VIAFGARLAAARGRGIIRRLEGAEDCRPGEEASMRVLLDTNVILDIAFA